MMLSLIRKMRLPLVGLPAIAAALVAVPGAASVPGTPQPARPARAAVDNPDAVLGAGWRASPDVLVAAAGDSTGFHLYVAKEKDAFAWSTLATLHASALDAGTWTGYACVTGTGRYAVAVYAPTMAANKPALLAAGAFAAVVDVVTGRARTVATGVQLAYFNPACGPGDRVLLTRAIGDDEQQTDLLTVDAAAGRVVTTRRINAQFTTPAPAPDDDYGIAHGHLVRVSATGALHPVAQPHGQAITVQATAHSGIDVLSGTPGQATVERYAGGALHRIATGPLDHLQLFGLTGGRDALVGDIDRVRRDVPELAAYAADRNVEAVSGRGDLLAERVLGREVAQTAADPFTVIDKRQRGLVDVTVKATRSGHVSSGIVATGHAPALDALPDGGPSTASPRAGAKPTAAQDDPDTPSCAVPRNDPAVQALQPSPDMVEWAVDQAVHGRLTVARPANYLKTGMPAYSPQGMFPLHHIAGGGTVPAQVMLGILAQESNLSEASWHAVPGDTGNPLISDYYGNRKSDGSTNIDVINYNNADCGYGIGQVTTGMHVGNTDYNHNQQVAIATDYAANIAAAVNVLIDKWNQVATDPAGSSWVNNGVSGYIENWWLALWAYNSGFHPSNEAPKYHGHWGVGWLNNPVNPQYHYGRDRFLLDYGDASHPADWSYPERVMGWAETPQRKDAGDAYARPDFGDQTNLALPINQIKDQIWPYTFCSLAVNHCDPSVIPSLNPLSDPCPAESDACWWHGTASYANCDKGNCSTEHISYLSSSGEPAIQRVYSRSCDDIDLSRDQYVGSGLAPVVYDLDDTDQYALGCPVHPNGGKFTLRVGSPPNGLDSPYGQIDLHQLGAGYQGHIWFTHVYPPSLQDQETPFNYKHEVVGTWSPDLPPPQYENEPPKRYDIVVHLPSHGGEYGSASYEIYGDPLSNHVDECVINQSTSGPLGGNGDDEWRYLGNYTLRQGAVVMLNNVGDGTADGTTDIAFDAMAFIPVEGKGHACKDKF
jgi:hypothetical protein